MNDLLKNLTSLGTLTIKNLVNVLDILLVAYLNYRILALIRGSRAWRTLGGIILFIAMLLVSAILHLETLHWLLDKAALLAPVALIILLLPEVRSTLELFGKGFWPQRAVEQTVEARTIEEIVAAVAELQASRIGALIVIERGPALDSIVSNGVLIDAEVSAPLLGSIFFEGNPLHDGAVVIRGDVLVAAACRLPLSENRVLDPRLHMRHRAAVGVTEELDCLSIVVSEERGTISLAKEGQLTQLSSHSELRDRLNSVLRDHEEEERGIFSRRRREAKRA